MSEGTPRAPHQRRYHDTDGEEARIQVDGRGIVQISEELLDMLLVAAGFTESPFSDGVITNFMTRES